jgi:hypothetical protein
MKTTTTKITATILLAVISMATGCVTGVVNNPDLKELVYDDEGVLRYQGKRVEGIKMELPWYKEMWPDNPAEWGFTLVTVGVAAAASGGGGGGGGGTEEVIEEPVAVTTTTSSKPRTDTTTTATTTDTDTGGGGGGGGGAPPPPPPGGGTELPF